MMPWRSLLVATLLFAVFWFGWGVNEACSTYRGAFRPADFACDLPFNYELRITFAQPPARERKDRHSICRASGGSQWQLDCDLPFERQLNIGFLSSRQPRVKCGLLVDCPAYY